ncbi:hypothetical protein G9A89_013254 [Geosiphon pyriformis]|nr:hypothetical protein G9A89_013254 [Geosiphon pyriformis]
MATNSVTSSQAIPPSSSNDPSPMATSTNKLGTLSISNSFLTPLRGLKPAKSTDSLSHHPLLPTDDEDSGKSYHHRDRRSASASFSSLRPKPSTIVVPNGSVGALILSKLKEPSFQFPAIVELLLNKEATLVLPVSKSVASEGSELTIIEDHIMFCQTGSEGLQIITLSGIKGLVQAEFLIPTGFLAAEKEYLQLLKSDPKIRKAIFNDFDTPSNLKECSTIKILKKSVDVFLHGTIIQAMVLGSSISKKDVTELLLKLETSRKLEEISLPESWVNVIYRFIGDYRKDAPRTESASCDRIQENFENVRTFLETNTSFEETDIDLKMDIVEDLVCSNLYENIFIPKWADDDLQDEKLQSKIASLNMLEIGLPNLGVNVKDSQRKNIDEAVSAAGAELQKLIEFKAPNAKLNVIVQCHRIIVETLERKPKKTSTEIPTKNGTLEKENISSTTINEQPNIPNVDIDISSLPLSIDSESSSKQVFSTNDMPKSTILSQTSLNIVNYDSVEPSNETQIISSEKESLETLSIISSGISTSVTKEENNIENLITSTSFENDTPLNTTSLDLLNNMPSSPNQTSKNLPVPTQEDEQNEMPRPNADSILPLLIYIVVKYNPQNLVANLRYIQRYRIRSHLHGEASYCLTNIMAAVAFLENVDLVGLGLSPAKVLSDVVELQQSSVAATVSRKVGQEIVGVADSGLKVITGVMDHSYKLVGRILGYNEIPAVELPITDKPVHITAGTPLSSTNPNNILNGLTVEGDAKELAELNSSKASTEINEKSSTKVAGIEESSKSKTDRFIPFNVIPRFSIDRSIAPPLDEETMKAENDGQSSSKIPPPIKRFLECSNEEFRVSDVSELLADYKRLAGAIADLGTMCTRGEGKKCIVLEFVKPDAKHDLKPSTRKLTDNTYSPNNPSFGTVDAFVYDEDKRSKESRAKLIILLIIGLLIAGYGAWNIWRMVEAVRSPVVTVKESPRAEIPVPGVVICGMNLNKPLNCYKSAFNAADDDFAKGEKCDEYITNNRIDATPFVNMRGYYNLTGQYCYVFSPQNPIKKTSTSQPLVFNNAVQKIALALWSNDGANNTLGAITNDAWFFYGIFSEKDDPKDVKFQIVKIPSISYAYFTRTEKIQNLNADAITGGNTGNGDFDSHAVVELDHTFTSFAISGFGISPNLWGLFRIIPRNYRTDPKTDTQIYPVDVYYSRVEFTLLQLAANMGGFISILSALYFLLLGSRRVDPWGVVQRYILKTVPAPPPAYTPTVFPYFDTKERMEDPLLESNLPSQSSQSFPMRPAYSQSQSGDSHIQNPGVSEIRAVPDYQVIDGLNDPIIQRLRHELRSEVQATIAKEIAKLRVYLSKYYLRDVVKDD